MAAPMAAVTAVTRRTRWRTTPAVVGVACLLLGVALTGCGGGGRGGGASTAASSATTSEVRAATVPGLGKILVDAAGYTLYIYTPDRAGPSTCSGLCARHWPPAVLPSGVARPTAGRGVRASLLGTDRRAGGARQITYDGWPLYTYEDDTAPGDVTGQGANMGLWYTMSVSGAVDRAVLRATKS